MDVLDFIGIDPYEFGDGSGSNFGSGSDITLDDEGSGKGSGKGSGFYDGTGYGGGIGEGISEINHQKVYMINNIPSIITQLHKNRAKGYILKKSLELEPCYIVKQNNLFAHGKTLKEALTNLQERTNHA